MHRKNLIRLAIALIIGAGCVYGAYSRVLVVTAAAAEDRIPMRYDWRLVPWPVDPNMRLGNLLPPISNDPNTWTVKPGKYYRQGTCWDFNDLPIAVTAVRGTTAPSGETVIDPNTITIDVNNVDHTWSVATEVTVGKKYIWLQAINLPLHGETPGKTFWTIPLNVADPNLRGPELQ